MKKGTILEAKGYPSGTIYARSAYARGDKVFFVSKAVWSGDVKIPATVMSVTWPTMAAGQKEANAIVLIKFDQSVGPYRMGEMIQVHDGDLVPHRRTSNPGRPPKRWMRKCVRSVEESGSAADPGSVCGALWHHKMSPAKKRAALAKERRGNPCCGEGYQPGFFSNPNKASY